MELSDIQFMGVFPYGLMAILLMHMILVTDGRKCHQFGSVYFG